MMIDAALPLLSVLYFLLPAALANVMPVLIKMICSCGFLATPMDFGVRVLGKPLLGKHKTWRGLVAGVLGGMFFAALQAMIGPTRFDLVDYQTSWLAIGTLLGFGAILGDALKSGLKRRVGIVEGSPWVPFDQIDFTIGALAFTSLLFWPGWPLAVASVAFYGLSHVFIVRAGHMLGLRKERW